MCYDAESLIKREIKAAKRFGASKAEIEELESELIRIQADPNASMEDVPMDEGYPAYYHVNGWSHPSMIVMTGVQPPSFLVAEWGFVASSVRYTDELKDHFSKPWLINLNARSETMFEKKTFSNAGRARRCAVLLESYYEHHHANGKTYPFRIKHKEEKPLWIAGIYNANEYVDRESGEVIKKNTFALLTCTANDTLSRIHNNPKMVKRAGSRMLVILDEEKLGDYLDQEVEGKADQDFILNLCQPYPDELLEYHSVRNLRDRKNMPTPGNVPEVRNEYRWQDLDYNRIFGT